MSDADRIAELEELVDELVRERNCLVTIRQVLTAERNRLVTERAELLAEATELLRNATYEDGVAACLTQDCEALQVAIAKAKGEA